MRRPPRSTLFPTRRSSDLPLDVDGARVLKIDGPRQWLSFRRDDVSAADLIARVASKVPLRDQIDRKSTRLNSSHSQISYAVFCLKKKKGAKSTIIVMPKYQ